MIRLEKNSRFTGECTDYTYDGLGVVKYDTFCVFVKDMAMGDVGEIQITAVRKDFCYGRLMKLITPSVDRTVPACPIARQCGGCQLQHLTYEAQLAFKQNHVESCIRRIGKIDVKINDIIGMKDPYAYRNKVQLPVGVQKGKTVVGFYRGNSHEIIPMESCILQTEKTGHVSAVIRELIDRYGLAAEVRHVMLRETDSGIMAVLVTYNENVDKLDRLVDDLCRTEKDIVSVIQNINPYDTNVVLGHKERVLYGSDAVIDTLCGLKFRISSHSFYQVNNRQTEVLYDQVLKAADLKGTETVWDLYCGVGTIGLMLSKHAGKIIGIEIIPAAIENARENTRINNIRNAEFILGDVKTALGLLKDRPDVVVVDPPRKGLDASTVEQLLNTAPDRIVYVSCNPSTLARDLNMMKEHYEIIMIQPVDMFPHTYHVESIALLKRVKQKVKI